MLLDKIKLFFRVIAFLEGISYIALIFIAVPLKYWMGNEQYVKILGMPHGVLFITYIFLALLFKKQENWNFKIFSIIILASIFPFGTFYVDTKYFSKF